MTSVVHNISVGNIIVKYIFYFFIFFSPNGSHFYFIHYIDYFFNYIIWKSKCIICSFLFSKVFQTRFLFKLNNNYYFSNNTINNYYLHNFLLITHSILIMFYHFRFKTAVLCLIFSLSRKSKRFTFYKLTYLTTRKY